MGEGTIKWKWLDDAGEVHTMIVKNSLYVPNSSICLLSPQHADKSIRRASSGKNRFRESTDSESCVMTLTRGKDTFTKTVVHTTRTNTPVFRSAPDNSAFNMYCMECEEQSSTNELEVTVLSSELMERDEKVTEDLPLVPIEPKDNLVQIPEGDSLKNIAEVISDSNQLLTAFTDEGELLRWHYRLGHLKWAKLKLLALLGIIPRKLAFLRQPPCSCCIATGMVKIPTRTKKVTSVRNIHAASRSGQYVSVDQMECSTPGFISQLKGRLTRKRYRVTTVYIDHFSDLTYTYNQESTTSAETLASKHAFEAYAREKGIAKISHYHSDNGRFIDNAFVNDCIKQGQTQSCCGVNAHHQNGKVEKRIRDLGDDARKLLIHSIFKWNGIINSSLWPYAFRHAANVRNTLPDKKDGTSPLERFSGTDIKPNLRFHHTFGCPVYALNNKLQQGQSIPRWDPRVRLGVYLGESPRHARSVSLVLNTNTGLVSPQFHVKHDDFFETIKKNVNTSTSSWLSVASFRSDDGNKPGPLQQNVLPSSTNANANHRLESSTPDILMIKGAHDADTGSNNVNNPGPNLPSEALPLPAPILPQLISPEESNYSRAPSLSSPQFNRDSNTSSIHHMRTRRVREKNRKYVSYNSYFDALHQEDFKLQDKMTDPIAFSAKDGIDTLHYGQAMRAADKKNFIGAMVKEVDDHVRRKHWEIVPISTVPSGHKVLDMV